MTKNSNMKHRFKNLLKLGAMAVFLMASLPIGASVNALEVNLKDGSAVIFPLGNSPVIKTSGNQLNVESSDESITIPFSDLESYSFTDDMNSGVSSAESDSERALVNGHILFSGLTDSEPICVYSADGMLRLQTKAYSDGTADIDITVLPQGAYVVTTLSSTFKFMNR